MTVVPTNPESLYPDHLDRYRRVYEDALAEHGARGLVISSGSMKTAFLDDSTYPFMVNPHFKTWLPILDNDESFIVLRPGERPILLYHQPRDYWHKPPANPAGFWVEHWDIRTIDELSDAHNAISDPASLVFIGEEEALARQWGFGSINPDNLLDAVHFERAYKTDYELACLQLANNNAAMGHLAAERAFREGLSEFDIQHRYLGAIGHRERETPYSGIVALNENCAVLHYQHYEAKPPARIHSMLIDAGASFNGYAADVTRTWAAEPGEFQTLIDAMNEQQQSIIEDIACGRSYADLHRDMQLRVARILKDFGFVDMTPEAMLETNVTFTFLPHGLGHFLGLQTHDVGGHQQNRQGDLAPPPDEYPALRLTRPIENRQVFTIEPGLYFIPMLLEELKQSKHGRCLNNEKIERFLPFGGIRIEDNIAMIDGAPANLTRNAFNALNTDDQTQS